MDAALKIFSIAVGGAFGSVARYLISASPLANVFEKFPFPTFVVNIIGSFLIGFLLIVFADRADVSENVKAAVMIGFIGAFTTFSTFEVEIFALARERQMLTAFSYILLSLVIGFLGLLAGVAIGRRV